jgi:predicted secreted hydrolase
MQRNSGGQYQLQIPARDFMLSLTLQPTQAVMLQGANGYSRKGALPEQASYYYSEPQLAVSGTITRQGKPVKVTGNAWLDHEWSSTVLDKNAVGWDWVGLNLADGGALMAFQIRSAEGKPVWQHAALRDAKGHTQSIDASRIRFMPLKQWRSPRTGASYPTSLQITINDVRWEVVPLQNDQELDSRLSTGSVYWEGAVTVLRNGQPAGRGYLEMTGYLKALKL